MDVSSQVFVDSRICITSAIVSLIIVVINHLLTFEDEVELVRKKKFSVVIVALLIFRYVSLLVLGAVVFLVSYPFDNNQVATGIGQMCVVGADAFLLWRTISIFSRDKIFGAWMITLAVGQLVMINYLVFNGISQLRHFVHVGPTIPGCYATDSLPIDFKYYSIVIMVASGIMLASIYIRGSRGGLKLYVRNAPLPSAIFADCLLCCASVFVMSSLHLIFMELVRETLYFLLVPFSLATYAIVGSRNFLQNRVICEAMLPRVEPASRNPSESLRFAPIISTDDDSTNTNSNASSTSINAGSAASSSHPKLTNFITQDVV